MEVVNEHPDVNVRKLYAGEVAASTGLPVADLVAAAQRRRVTTEFAPAPQRRRGGTDSAEFVALALLVQRWDDIAPWLVPELFHQEVERRAFDALADSGGDLDTALAGADPEAREVLERVAVADVDADPLVEVRTLVTAAVRRSLQSASWGDDPEALRLASDARRTLEGLDDPATAPAAMTWLLGWLAAPPHEGFS
jgi:DNA primase